MLQIETIKRGIVSCIDKMKNICYLIREIKGLIKG